MKDLKIEKVNAAKKTDPRVSCSRDKQCQNLNTIVIIYMVQKVVVTPVLMSIFMYSLFSDFVCIKLVFSQDFAPYSRNLKIYRYPKLTYVKGK